MTQISLRPIGLPALLVAATIALYATPQAFAETAVLAEGRGLVEANCGNCHGVGEADASPHEAAPPFRNLSDSFPIDALEEAFADGRIYSGHPDMPEFIATPQQVDAIIAYIASLQE